MTNEARVVTIASALFQSAAWLQCIHPKGTPEYQIGDICWQAHDFLEEVCPASRCGTTADSSDRPALEDIDVLEETVLNLEGLEEEVRIIKRRVREHMKAWADRPTQEPDHD